MASQRRKEREEFFRGLGLLDEFDHISDEAGQRRDSQQHSRPVLKPERNTRQQRSSVPQPTRPSPLQTTAIHHKTPGSFEVSHPSTSPNEAKAASPHRLVESDTGGPPRAETGMARRKRKRKTSHEFIPEEQRLFSGSCFYFIPNRDTPAIRRLRIEKAVANGAVWARTWDMPITHIIVDSNLSFEQASNYLLNAKPPEGIPMITENWLVECFSRKIVWGVDNSRFYVKGMRSPFSAEETVLIEPGRNSEDIVIGSGPSKPTGRTLKTQSAT